MNHSLRYFTHNGITGVVENGFVRYGNCGFQIEAARTPLFCAIRAAELDLESRDSFKMLGLLHRREYVGGSKAAMHARWAFGATCKPDAE